jgi:phenylalanyl-tRNA synthetase beta chain
VTGAVFEPAKSPYLHPGRSASFRVQGKDLGSFGELHPTTAQAFDLTAVRQILVGEFDLEALLALVPPRYGYRPIPRFPAALRDVAVIVDESMSAARVEAEILAAGGDLLAGARLFDLYKGASIAAGKKSLAYALTYQAAERTLTDKEVDKAHKKIEDRLRHVLKAQIRGKD